MCIRDRDREAASPIAGCVDDSKLLREGLCQEERRQAREHRDGEGQNAKARLYAAHAPSITSILARGTTVVVPSGNRTSSTRTSLSVGIALSSEGNPDTAPILSLIHI